MKPQIILFLLLTLIKASTNELFLALSERCYLNPTHAASILFSFDIFTVKLKCLFLQTGHDATNWELLRELSASNVWLFLSRTAPYLPEQLKAVRDVIDDISGKVIINEECLLWLDNLLGDNKDSFSGSYLELLIKSLSATGDTKMVELTNKQMFSVITKIRSTKLEREHLFLSRNEELHDIYVQYLLLYNSLFKLPLGSVIGETTTFSVFSYFQSESLTPRPSDNNARDLNFLSKYVDISSDLISFDNCLHLKKSTNFSLVYSNWARLITMLPEASKRKIYFDEEMDLAQNVLVVEWLVFKMYFQKDNSKVVKNWSQKVLVNLSLTFDLIESLASYEGQSINMKRSKDMLVEIVSEYLVVGIFSG